MKPDFNTCARSTISFALNTQPTLNVLGSFDGGGNNQGNILDHQDHYELQNYTSIIHGNHTVKFGARLRGIRDANSSTSGFNGEFTFSSLLDTPRRRAACPLRPAPARFLRPRDSERWQPTHANRNPTHIRKAVRPSRGQFRRRTLLPGRLEGALQYHFQLWSALRNADRHSGSCGPGAALGACLGSRRQERLRPKSCLRGGFGIFYDRFQEAQILEARAPERHHAGTVRHQQSQCPRTDKLLTAPRTWRGHPATPRSIRSARACTRLTLCNLQSASSGNSPNPRP